MIHEVAPSPEQSPEGDVLNRLTQARPTEPRPTPSTFRDAEDTLPQSGDVVSCYYSEDETPNIPGLKARPVLILQMRRRETDGTWFALVAYGTSVNLEQLRPGELLLSSAESLSSAGLHRPTKFVFKRHRWLEFNRQWFRANRNKTCVLGRLMSQDMTRAQQTIADARTEPVARIVRATRPAAPQAGRRYATQILE